MAEWTGATSAGFLEAAPDAMIVVGRDGRMLFVNAQAERLFGYSRRELVGQLVELLVPEAVRSVHPAHRTRYMADPKPRSMGAGMDLVGRRKDGTEFPVEISLSAFDADDGLLVCAAIRDVSERRRAAEAQSQLASIVQSSHDAIIGKTVEGAVTSWNPGAERLFGYAAHEVIGRSIEVLVPEERRGEEKEILARITRGERVEQHQTERVRKDGVVVTISHAVSPITDGAGRIVGVASVSRDLSDRERAEAKFRGLLEAAPDAIVGVGLDGRIVLVNTQAERLFGYPREELVGQPVEILVPEQARDAHVGYRTAYAANPHPRPMGAGKPLTGRRRDGVEFPAEISLSGLMTEDGSLALAAVRDVSDRVEAESERERLKAQAERERLESQLHQSQRLESLGQLAGGVAHDFNNLLAVILNYASFVSEELADADRRWQGVREDVLQIQRAAERATALTHQLLAFGRREVVRPQVLDLNAVVAEVEQLLRRTLGEHVELVTSLAPGLWPIVADPGQVEQVLVNLAVNARDAMPGGGSLTIDTQNVHVDAGYASRLPGLEVGRYVRLRVSDTGTGMPKDVIDRAFEPFFTTKPRGEGSGLGLATVYGIVTQAGGYAQIYSEPDVGTTFSALLPAGGPETATPERGPDVAAAAQGETVLVVEDEDAMREVTRRMLSRAGYEVVAAADGREALAMAADEDVVIDLLLTDVVMPHMLGKEVAERVRAIRPSVRVLYMSGYAQPVLATQGTLEPGVTLIEKPFSAAELLAKVRAALDDPTDQA